MRMLLTVFMVVLICSLTVLAHSDVNDFQGNITYNTIYVQAGDTVWNIAAKEVTDKEDIRKRIGLIQKANGLDNNAHLYPGQALKVPVKW
ncbi:LysM repeat protein [Sporomusaceae bacterium BoRhaA]|uniref:LysM peptidoglycan-binding domain-containing protein n=1 Tax=Pelorhabdus rhamnosifermentans TaxID=2772457 RepID=UPI001C062084|nr:LysM repeat protein [Pelorhabdus rhamnosifermentans]